jgi:hypothetical protein
MPVSTCRCRHAPSNRVRDEPESSRDRLERFERPVAVAVCTQVVCDPGWWATPVTMRTGSVPSACARTCAAIRSLRACVNSSSLGSCRRSHSRSSGCGRNVQLQCRWRAGSVSGSAAAMRVRLNAVNSSPVASSPWLIRNAEAPSSSTAGEQALSKRRGSRCAVRVQSGRRKKNQTDRVR